MPTTRSQAASTAASTGASHPKTRQPPVRKDSSPPTAASTPSSQSTASSRTTPAATDAAPPASPPTAASAAPATYRAAPLAFLHTYPVTHNEIGVLTIEPYKAALLPHWRFKTPAVARTSAAALWERFVAYGAADDFVGMDMSRKFLQMGMTRAKRYANFQGGKKYEGGRLRAKGAPFEGKADKEEASRVFREYWERCKRDEKYAELKAEFLARRKELEKEEGRKLGVIPKRGGGGV